MSKIFSFIKKPVGILTILLVVTAGGFGYYFTKYNAITKDPQAITKQKAEEAKKKTDALVKKISELIVVTDASNAVSATITDKEKLKDERFFDLAQNGDDLILFPKMMKAVLYRPSINKIIDVGPFNPNATAQPSVNAPATPSAPNAAPAAVKASTTVKTTATSTTKR